ncbi:Lrp/AsnC family transcriptional regulator [Pseudomonas gingeri NCPPB 3146 = LMG 5327]|uniref:Lrp/AsnC family transcriptional regulator n=2 Tax=Pseudomonas gingeri TaxID=117681 RepID=A0A7Y8CBD0_9PSED|nr:MULTISPECIES: Lrp/AsnC family transcriptional regulator [Pseudomonas]NWC13075.1 Lrp/AsnC family transcriptional regulator [Pseudomonas gingeri]PNQ88427.1 Lrp/AsnC family transcriptional regulator [Pseudomonas gingeri NCPPB 3146 = LMG 5327]BBP77556.1 transcriptional regulator [Pseudomonas sp. Ost2]
MHKLDRYDLNILRILSEDGRITKSNLAEAINLSVTPAWERVRKLESAGLVKGYRALIDWNQVFKSQQLLVEITLARHTAQDMRRFEQRMSDAREVQFCYATGGGVDYIAMIQAADIDQYQRFIDQLLLEDLGIERYFTYIVTKTIKTGGAPPAQALNALLATD